MGNDVRWLAVAVIMGLCTAYALWGDRSGPPEPPNIVSPPPAAPITPVKVPAPVPAPALPSSALRFLPPQVDFGEVLVGQNKSATVKVTNSGSTPLTVGSIAGSCGCLKAEMLQRKLAPGQSESLLLTYIGLSGKRPEKYFVHLVTDEPGQPNVKLEVFATVKQEFRLEPEQISFEQVMKGESKTVEVNIRRNDGTAFEIKQILCARAEFSFKWEQSAASGSAYKIFATINGLQNGTITESAAIHTNHPLLPVVTFNMMATILGEVTAVPAVLSATQTGNQKPAFETVIKRSPPRPGIAQRELKDGLQILSITENDGAALTFDTERLDAGSVRIIIRLNEAFTRNPAVGEFAVRTNAEDDPLRLPFRVLRPGLQNRTFTSGAPPAAPVRTQILSPALRGLAPPRQQNTQPPLLPPEMRRSGPNAQP